MRQHALKILILLILAYAIAMMLHWVPGFTYFTQLSNIFTGLIVLLQLLLRYRSERLVPLRPWKFAASVSMVLTFLVYLLLIAPFTPGGMLAAYLQDHGASLCFHILIPVLTVTDFLRHDAAFPWKKRHIGMGLVPPLLYLLFILLLGQAGYRWGFGEMLAPYAFLNYAAPAGWFGWMPETADYTTMGIGVFYAIPPQTRVNESSRFIKQFISRGRPLGQSRCMTHRLLHLLSRIKKIEVVMKELI